jgi:hypothetical protein
MDEQLQFKIKEPKFTVTKVAVHDAVTWVPIPAIKESSDYTDFLIKKTVDGAWERVFTLESKDVLDLQIKKTNLSATETTSRISWDDFRRAFLWKHLDYPTEKRETYLHRFLSLSLEENYYWYNLITSDDYPYASVALTILLDQK